MDGGATMPADETASKGDETPGLVIGINAGRRRGLGVLYYLAALIFLGVIVAGAAFLATQPLTGKGTISQSQLATGQERPQEIHGFRELRPGEAPDTNTVQP